MTRRAPLQNPPKSEPAKRGGSPSYPSLSTPTDDLGLGQLSEGLRVVALGGMTALITARAYYPSEDAADGTGLWWVFSILIVVGLGVVAQLLSGRTTLRLAWADLCVLVLFILVAASAGGAVEQRGAMTLAWEWAGLGLLYLLARNLPRTREESSTLAGVWVASAVAVAAYGLYQAGVELPDLRAAFRANPDRMLIKMGYEPGSPPAELFKLRALESKEPFSTFGLANSFAGYLVGPLVLALAVALENLRREAKGSRFVAYLSGAIPLLTLAVCLLLTKSRSAWIGSALAVGILGVRAWAKVSKRSLLIASGASAAVLVLLVGAGLATRQLDRQVLTESTKSLRYRLEYWAGTWALLRNQPSPYAPSLPAAMSMDGQLHTDDRNDAARPEAHAFWQGLGPGNFSGPYLRHKLPQASEEIKDPHNLIMEAWSTAGLPAAIALILAIGVGLATILRGDEAFDSVPQNNPSKLSRAGPIAIVVGGIAGWILVALTGRLDPFDPKKADLMVRWLILGAAWGASMVLGAPIWNRRAIPAAGLALAALALTVNLLAAGGIGIPTVAMGLWLPLAIGLSLRADRACGRLRSWP